MKKLVHSLVFLCVSGITSAAPFVTITPSSTSLTIGSDGSTSVIYTVTNNSSSPQPAITVNPTYQTTGQGSEFALQNDTCTGTTLAPKGESSDSCQFGIVIQGVNQPSEFSLSPLVCAGHGIICASSSTAYTLKVNVTPINSHPFAYLESSSNHCGLSSQSMGGKLVDVLQKLTRMQEGSTLDKRSSAKNSMCVNDSYTSEVTPMDTTNDSLGNPVTDLFLASYWFAGSSHLIVSPDGNHVYVLEQPNENTQNQADVAVLNGGASASLSKRIELPGSFGYVIFDSMAISPDGQTLYVSAIWYTNDYPDSALYRINLTNDEVTTVPLPIASMPTYRFWPLSLAITPDSKRLFITGLMDPGNYDPSTGAILALNTSTDTESGFIYDETDPYFQIPWDLAMSPDGSTLYVSNDQGGDTSGIFAINIKSPTYPIIGHTSVFKPESMTISSNGNYLYATYTSGEQPLVARIDTQAWLHSGDGLDHSGPYGDGTQDNSYITHIPLEYIGSGVALTPDQSQLFVAASNSFNGLQAVSDPAGASPTGRVVLSPNNYLIQGSNFIG